MSKKYVVIHPLDDEPEEKRTVKEPLVLSRTTKTILTMLQVYLLIMVILLVYKVLSYGKFL